MLTLRYAALNLMRHKNMTSGMVAPTGGRPVQAAGEALIMKTESGLVGDFFSSHSGHFFNGKLAETAAALPLGKAAFEALGIKFSKRITP